jgi:hypothetical protein
MWPWKTFVLWRCFAFIDPVAVAGTSGTSTESMLLQQAVIVNLNLGSLLLFVDPIDV